MSIGQTDMSRPDKALGLAGRVGDQWDMRAYHQGPGSVNSPSQRPDISEQSTLPCQWLLQNRRGPYKRLQARWQWYGIAAKAAPTRRLGG